MEYNLWHIGLFLLVLPRGLYQNATYTNTVHQRGAFMWFAIVLFFIYTSTMAQLCISFWRLMIMLLICLFYFSQCVWPFVVCVSDKGAVTRLLGIHVQMQPIHIFSVGDVVSGISRCTCDMCSKRVFKIQFSTGLYMYAIYGAIYEGCRWLLT